LDGGVDGEALSLLLDVLMASEQLGDGAAAAKEGGDEAGLLGTTDQVVKEGLDLGVVGEEAVNEALGVVAGGGQVAGEVGGADAVDHAEVDGFTDAALVGGDGGGLNAVDGGGGEGVDVEVLGEGGEQGGVLGAVGEQAQLDLAVVGAQEAPAVGGDEGATR